MNSASKGSSLAYRPSNFSVFDPHLHNYFDVHIMFLNKNAIRTSYSVYKHISCQSGDIEEFLKENLRDNVIFYCFL